MAKENITLKQIDDLKKKLKSLKTIGEWKVTVKQFATENQLTDREAIDIANNRLLL